MVHLGTSSEDRLQNVLVGHTQQGQPQFNMTRHRRATAWVTAISMCATAQSDNQTTDQAWPLEGIASPTLRVTCGSTHDPSCCLSQAALL